MRIIAVLLTVFVLASSSFAIPKGMGMFDYERLKEAYKEAFIGINEIPVPTVESEKCPSGYGSSFQWTLYGSLDNVASIYVSCSGYGSDDRFFSKSRNVYYDLKARKNFEIYPDVIGEENFKKIDQEVRKMIRPNIVKFIECMEKSLEDNITREGCATYNMRQYEKLNYTHHRDLQYKYKNTTKFLSLLDNEKNPIIKNMFLTNERIYFQTGYGIYTDHLMRAYSFEELKPLMTEYGRELIKNKDIFKPIDPTKIKHYEGRLDSYSTALEPIKLRDGSHIMYYWNNWGDQRIIPVKLIGEKNGDEYDLKGENIRLKFKYDGDKIIGTWKDSKTGEPNSFELKPKPAWTEEIEFKFPWDILLY